MTRGKTTVRVARAASRTRAELPLYVLDAALVAAGYAAVLLLRFDGSVPNTFWTRFALFIPVVVVAHLISNWRWGLYRQMWRHASVDEARRVLLAGMTVLLVVAPAYFVLEARPVPLSVFVLGALVATALVGVLRYQSRLFAFRRRDTNSVTGGLRVVVVGAGEAGAAIVREMTRKPAAGLIPVAVLDDDPRKQGLSLLGVPIVGGCDALVETVERFRAHRVVLAIPTAGGDLVRRVAASAEDAQVPLQIVPEIGELIRGSVSLRDVRDLRIEDLIGRQQVKTDLEAVRRLLCGRRVLITGGGGSIGAELARQVSEFFPESLILLDSDETHLHDAVAQLQQPAETALCDIRSLDAVRRVFEKHRPEIVFHAAALKHVPVLESHPCEAVATNVLGTHAVISAAEAFGVERIVLISTDKAVHPSSVMGASKWFAEQLLLGRASSGAANCAVRFGNVVGSRGSVIPTFARQIAAGGPVTVTHPEMTRYFMSTEEAVQLVLQAAVFASGGEVFMLEMGEPVNILELAERMIRLSGLTIGEQVSIEIVGTRPGEKLTEELRTPDELCEPTAHEAVVRLAPTVVSNSLLVASYAGLEQAVAEHDEEVGRRLLRFANGEQDVFGTDAVIDLTASERSVAWNLSST